MVTNFSISKAQEYLEKAYYFQLDGNYDEAIKNYQLSIKYFPTAEAHTFLGRAYSIKGNLEKAMEECRKAIEIDPDYGNPYSDMGAYLIQLGNYDEAITWLELALKSKRYETPQIAHMNLGRAYELKGLWYEAIDEYKTALEADPENETARNLYFALQGKLN
jgi:tetratricopeptide (TPR) repeat protein